MGTSSSVCAELVDACRGSAGSFWLLFAALSELQPELSEPRDNKYRRALAKWLKPWSYGKQNQTLNKRASFLQGCRRPAPVSPRVSQPCQRLCFCMHASRSIPRGLVCSTLCHCCWLFFSCQACTGISLCCSAGCTGSFVSSVTGKYGGMLGSGNKKNTACDATCVNQM